MKHLSALAMSIMVCVSSAGAQTSDVHQRSALPPNARFEIVQSELAAKWTFRLDRFSGHVAQLVHTSQDDDAWEEMQVIGLSQTGAPAKAHFQLFASGLAAKHTFLIVDV